MLKKRAIDPLVLGFVVTILIVSALIISGSISAESMSIGKDKIMTTVMTNTVKT